MIVALIGLDSSAKVRLHAGVARTMDNPVTCIAYEIQRIRPYRHGLHVREVGDTEKLELEESINNS